MDERRPLDYYITCIFWGSGICDNARHRASLNRCARPITTWRKSERLQSFMRLRATQ